jgi:hypothetical protein
VIEINSGSTAHCAIAGLTWRARNIVQRELHWRGSTRRSGLRHAVFAGQIEGAVTDPWVLQHIVPVVHLPTFDTRSDLLNAFWEFWMEHKDGATVIADCGTPVEAGLFRACIELDLENRLWEGPKPLHELATALLLAGYDPWDTDRRELSGRTDLVQHDPVDDAIAAALCWEKITAPFVTENDLYGHTP